jgi:PKD repeat protein
MRKMRLANIVWLGMAGLGLLLAQPPANDNCANASLITFPNNNYGLGVFYSDVVDITGATLQPGEYIPPGVPNGKTVWYRFFIPTTRTIRIVLRQVETNIDPTKAGWTLYRTNSCLPGAAQRVDPPIVLMEGYTHACLRRGWYLVQVGADLAVSGEIFLEIQVDAPRIDAGAEANYDHAAMAQNLGVLNTSSWSSLLKDVSFEVACQSVHPGEAICDNDSSWSKSTWHVFRTDGHIDWLGIRIGEDPWNSTETTPREWRVFLYQGDARTDPNSLTLIEGCIPFQQVGSRPFPQHDFLCQLQANTYYTIRILYRTDYSGNVRLQLFERGEGPSIGTNPSTLPASHQFGVLSMGPTYTVYDNWSCNARISLNRCGNLTPTDTINGRDLALYYTFTITGQVHVYLSSGGCGATLRLFKNDNPTSCDNNYTYIGEVGGSGWFYCLPAGTYIVQALQSINRPSLWGGGCAFGRSVSLSVSLGSTPLQHFGLHTRPNEADSINDGNPLTPGVTYYATRDTIDCRTTILPAGDVCGSGNDRAIYRIIKVDQPGILEIGGGNWSRFRYRLYRGDARIEPIVGGRIQNLIDQAGCQSTYYPFKVCVTPGTYTLVSFADGGDIGERDRPWVRFHVFPAGDWRFYDPSAPVSTSSPWGPGPQEVGTLSSSVTSLTAQWTRFTCENNPLTILGYAPCGGATKQAYWEVYIAEPSLVTFSPNEQVIATEWGVVGWRTFRGRISDGSLTGLEVDCHRGYTRCMAPGWYTFVAYAVGGTYANPSYTGGRGGAIGNQVWFTISRDPRSQKYGTFATADRPGTLDWGPNSNTAYAPKNDRTYTLDWEFWSCADNLPFPDGITPCNPSHNRVSYRVFSITKPSYVTIRFSGSSGASRLYQGDITALLPPYSIIHDCSNHMRICWLPPGTYTLVTFAGDAHIGSTVTPIIYVDSVDYSARNYARNAYDFGNIPPDNVEYRTRLGDPLGPFGRPGSTDWFFCTTDAFITDPKANCPLGADENPPAVASDNPPTLLPDRRRNLWYTFTVSDPGRVFVSVYPQTPGASQPAFAVYESDDLGFNPPTTVDSTLAQGLRLVVSSQDPWSCCPQYQTISFYRDPCNNVPKRYYVVVERNTCGKEPNIQIEVGIRVQPVPPSFVLYDHYSEANVISGNPTTTCAPPYPNIALPAGTYTGCEGDLTCATKDPTDQNTCGVRTIWYKFTSDVTGWMYINYDRPGTGSYYYNANDIQVYYQAIPGDSTSSGLIRVPLTADWWTHPTLGYRYWGRACVRKGATYYIMFTGCNHLGKVVPRVWLEQHLGDHCADSLTLSVTGAGTFTVSDIIVDCLTIGESPGESDTTMGCMGSPVGKKSMWLLVQNLTPDTMDFDIQIIENTTALGGQVLYRVMTGDCNAMNQDECVAEGTYIILHLKCRLPLKSFWVHVVLPEWATGTLDVKITASPIGQPCIPPNSDCPIARFDAVAGCYTDMVQFINYSSVGPGISYFWDFGDGFTSTLSSPQHWYAVPDTYLVRLIVDNGVCKDTALKQVIVYPKPGVSFTYSPSAPVWIGVPITFTPTYTDTLPGMGAYIEWDFCASGGCAGTSPVDYSGPVPGPVIYSTPGTRRICVHVTNGLVCDSVYCVDIPIIHPPLPGGPYDGAARAVLSATCPTLSYVGGPYDGAAVAREVQSCVSYAGGPYDGAVRAVLTATCPTLSYAGGPYDGAAVAREIQSCVSYAGGPYDGAVRAMLTSTCPTVLYAGGPYDGASRAVQTQVCWTIEYYHGGPYDGASRAAIIVCPPPEHPYAGGPYDGAVRAVLTATCPTLSYAGGPYDGAAVLRQVQQCVSYAGGPYDGAVRAVLTATCPTLSYAGGPYDGAAVLRQVQRCVSYAGGPYDGAVRAVLTATCPTLSYAGGPYDGASRSVALAACIWPVAGGPYDGAARAYLASFYGRDTFACKGSPVTVQASAPADWYLTPSGGTPVATGVSSLTIPALTSSQLYYLQNACAPSRVPVLAAAIQSLQASFSVSAGPYCPNQPIYLSNQTQVAGPSQPTIGSLIVGTGTVGTPGRIAFSSWSQLNFSQLYDGTCQNGTAWTANNAGPGTVWASWTYVRPMSVNRIVLCQCQSCANAAQRSPMLGRLYYDNGSGWQLVRLIRFPYPFTGWFDTGVFVETQGIFATRWKLEFDVNAAQAPVLGEFQVYASYPVIGGNIQWSFDGGSSWVSGGTATFTPPAAGTYTIQMVASAPGACPDTESVTLTVDPCGPLPVVQSLLAGRPVEGGLVELQWQANMPAAWARLERLKDTAWVPLYRHEVAGSQTFTWVDSFPSFTQANVYRVVSEHGLGTLVYSNLVSVELTLSALGAEEFVRAFPNPVTEEVTLQLGLREGAVVQGWVYDARGALVGRLPEERFSAGLHERRLNATSWATGVYFLEVEWGGKAHTIRLLKIVP